MKNTIATILLTFLLGNYATLLYAQSNATLPEQLITTYTGVLTSTANRTKVNTRGTCTIKARGYRTYIFNFSDNIPSISGVKFLKNDDTYTATANYNGKTLAITVDEEGDLVIGSTGTRTIAFSGSIENDRRRRRNHSQNTTVTNRGNNDIHLSTRSTGIYTDEDQTHIGTKDAGIHTNNNGNVSIGTGDSGIRIQNGTIALGTGDTGVSVNSTNNSRTQGRSRNNTRNYGSLIACNSSEISALPKKILGIYKGKLVTRRTDTKKGICTIVKTACKTYRLDFSNGIHSIHNVQFGRKNNFDEYTSVIINGEYSSAIEIDMTFNDLEIDGEILSVSFDGKKN